MKRIVICSDGTWNNPDQLRGDKPSPTNVTKMALAVSPKEIKHDTEGKVTREVEQVVYYDKGVGTEDDDRIRGGAFGRGLNRNILEAYRFLVERFDPGDQLYFFGFSRGAFTVRSTVGMIRKCGILRREHARMICDAFRLYRRGDPAAQPNEIEARLFRKSFAHQVYVKFIGVWDTVGALGVPWNSIFNRKYRFHDVNLSSWVGHAYHALAIDEQRGPFKPALWRQQSHAECQDFEQRWFAGVHSNVGGGYQDGGLSDLAFEWIAGKAEDCGLVIDRSNIELTDPPNPLARQEDSRNWLYKLLPRHLRPIDEGVNEDGDPAITNETVDDSAIERFETTIFPSGAFPSSSQKRYQPANLAEYLRRESE